MEEMEDQFKPPHKRSIARTLGIDTSAGQKNVDGSAEESEVKKDIFGSVPIPGGSTSGGKKMLDGSAEEADVKEDPFGSVPVPIPGGSTSAGKKIVDSSAEEAQVEKDLLGSVPVPIPGGSTSAGKKIVDGSAEEAEAEKELFGSVPVPVPVGSTSAGKKIPDEEADTKKDYFGSVLVPRRNRTYRGATEAKNKTVVRAAVPLKREKEESKQVRERAEDALKREKVKSKQVRERAVDALKREKEESKQALARDARAARRAERIAALPAEPPALPAEVTDDEEAEVTYDEEAEVTDDEEAEVTDDEEAEKQELITSVPEAYAYLVTVLSRNERKSRNDLVGEAGKVINGSVLRNILQSLDHVPAPCGTVKFRRESKNKQAYHYWLEDVEPDNSSDKLQVIQGVQISIKKSLVSLDDAVTCLSKVERDKYTKQANIISEALKKMEELTSEKLAGPHTRTYVSAFIDMVGQIPSSSGITNPSTTISE